MDSDFLYYSHTLYKQLGSCSYNVQLVTCYDLDLFASWQIPSVVASDCSNDDVIQSVGR